MGDLVKYGSNMICNIMNLIGVTLQGRDADVVTPQQVEYMGMEYDNNIHLQDTAYFGNPMSLMELMDTYRFR